MAKVGVRGQRTSLGAGLAVGILNRGEHCSLSGWWLPFQLSVQLLTGEVEEYQGSNDAENLACFLKLLFGYYLISAF